MFSSSTDTKLYVGLCRLSYLRDIFSFQKLYSESLFSARITRWRRPLRVLIDKHIKTSVICMYTDLQQICKIGRTMAVDKKDLKSFFDLSRDVAVATNFVDQIQAQYLQL